MKKTKKIILRIAGVLGLVFALSSFKVDFFEIAKQIEIHNTLFKEINMSYVDETNPGELMEIGVKKMLSELDPYTVYSSEQDVESAKMRQAGDFVGIGCKLKFIKNELTVVEVYKSLPADKSGIKPGDKLVEINGVSVLGFKDGVGALLEGKQNTQVNIKLNRGGDEKEILVKRGDKKAKAVPVFKLMNNGVGYIALSRFSRGSAKEVESALKFLMIDEAKSLILDLRDNPGGLLGEAVEIVNLFVPKDQLVVSTKSNIKEYNGLFVTRKQPLSIDIPIVVLINERSASASEIVAGALQDLDRAVVVGKRSFGKGLVQQPKPLPYGAQIKITISRYYTPSGRCIQALNYGKRKEGGKAEKYDFNKEPFLTKNGRTVYGGGGVEPDIYIGEEHPFNIISALRKESLFFTYAVNFIKKNNIKSIEGFELRENHFNQFKQFCLSSGFDLGTTTEAALNKAILASEDESLFVISKKLRSVVSSMEKEKEHLLDIKKEDILNNLSKEIIKIKFYKEGLYGYSFLKDKNIKKGVEVLVDTGVYYSILK